MMEKQSDPTREYVKELLWATFMIFFTGENRMDVEKQLVEMEKQFWTGGEGYYRENLTEDALMAFPEPIGLMEKDATAEAIARAPRWEDVRFEDVHSLRPARDVAVLVYQASARREGEDTPYSAVVSSTYVERNGSWKLTFHQQTPGAAT